MGSSIENIDKRLRRLEDAQDKVVENRKEIQLKDGVSRILSRIGDDWLYNSTLMTRGGALDRCANDIVDFLSTLD